MTPVFITGIGTGIGKTLVSAIVTEALQADYWKPVQAGFDDGTDTGWIQERVSNTKTVFHKEAYKLALPASPHIAAKEEKLRISLDVIASAYQQLPSANDFVVIEGAGGIFVPLNEDEFVIDLIAKLNAKVILVSRNYLGSINHSILTAEACKARNLNVSGWIFNDQYMHYESEIARWSGYPSLGSVPFTENPDKRFVQQQAVILRSALQNAL
jgi:dethiobiotin synthetase